ncbi:MAG: REP-associated tyrosine transposase [Shewanella sp.]|uniref:REP-associated tyrosine transposase n=1 Tax=Shewanella sp. TaxID=50422 RepID=UPI003F2D0488
MSRPLRLEFAGALYHITARGNERKAIYFEEGDFELYLDILDAVCSQRNWIIHAYCLMDNHYHLLLETPDGNLSKGMRQLNGVFTQAMNKKHHRVGHIFQGRYKAILVDKEVYLLELCRYIVLNPLRAKMVDKLEDWPWSSWSFTIGKNKSPDWLATDAILSCFGNDRVSAINAYIRFVEDGLNRCVWNDLKHQIYLGDEEFVKKHQELQDLLVGDLSEIPLKQRRLVPKALSEYQQIFTTRDEAIIQSYRSGGYTLKQIGEYFGIHYSLVSRIVGRKITP